MAKRNQRHLHLCRESAGVLPLGSQFAISIDGAVLESPLGNVLITPSRLVADRVVGEWCRQIGKLTRFETLPATLLLAETVDFHPQQRDTVVGSLVDALDFDTALRFDMQPPVTLPPLEGLSALDRTSLAHIVKLDLDVLQSSYIAPILHGFAARRGTSALITAGDVASRLRQPVDVVTAVRVALSASSVADLVAICKMHKCLRSVVLPLELCDGAIDAARAIRASRLEETLQAASWGVSSEFRENETSMLQQIIEALEFRRAYGDPAHLTS
ncbi:uncharacterized protein BXIN_1828 [Babesia sp. Xinjiang]|uniref:uncharacterized protein n=1 Tax=Babesia sp. Xinjiang TaxID=462227 RepID=UPI000A247146|nr:uncharacterized protein BXIN_1828 [Babesia sp. Xinjiang]ORM40521.1 hypothetical protein BXIN_1828 [Babesia sp. Xinjiang]